MKQKLSIFILVFLSFQLAIAQVNLASWNIQHLGKSKSEDNIAYMAEILRDFDIIAIQEVVAGPGGAQAVARLADELNRKGSKWDFKISDPTKSSPYSSERYAYLWKTNKVKIQGKAFLDQNFVDEIEREPYVIRFSYKDETITLFNFHAVPTKKQPEGEVKYFRNYPDLYPDETLIFMGDFNLVDHHTVFNPLKNKGYKLAFDGQKTSLKMKCDTQKENDCLSKVYDHFIFPSKKLDVLKKGVIHFYKDFEDIKLARKVSDHIPIWIEFEIETK